MIDLNLNYNIKDYEKFSNNLKEDYYLKLFIGEKTIHNILNSLDKAEFKTNSVTKHLPEYNGILKLCSVKNKNSCIDCGLILNDNKSEKKCSNCISNPIFPKTQIANLKNNELYFNKFVPMMMSNINLNNNKFIKYILDNENLKNILKQYFKGENYRLREIGNNSIFHNENNGNMNRVFKQMYHIDEINQMYWKYGKSHRIRNNKKYHKFIKLYIPLSDVNENNGTLTIVKKSNILEGNSVVDFNNIIKYDAARFTDDFINKKFNKSDIISLNAKVGEIYLVRTDGLHKGGYVNGKGKRTVLYLTFENC